MHAERDNEAREAARLGRGGSLGSRFGLVVLVIGVVLLMYLPCVRYELLGWDDIDYVTENPALRLSLGDFLRQVTTRFVPRQHGDFLPVTQLSFWLEFQAVGLAPWLYHLDNVLLYAAMCAVLGVVLVRITARRHLAWVVALLFAAHPLNTEVVAWVSERKSVLSALFCWSAFLLVLPAGENDRPVRSRWIGSVVLYALACWSKSAVVFFPVVLWGHRWIIARRPFVRSLLPALPYVVLAGLTAWGRLRGHEVSGQAAFEPFDSARTQGLTILGLLGEYVTKMLVPVGLNHCYPLEVSKSLADPYVWIGAVMLVAGLAGTMLLRRELPLASFGLVWFLAGWLPHMQLSPIPPALRADRYMFYALPGFALFLVAMFDRMMAGTRQANRRLALISLASIGVVVLGVASARRSAVWRNEFVLWEDSLRKQPDTAMAHSHYGVVLFEAGRVEEAETHFRRALEKNDRDMMSLNGMAAILSQRGEYVAALKLLRVSLQEEPEVAETHASIGECELALHNFEAAVDAYQRAVQLKPYLPGVQSGYASALALAGRIDDAITHHLRAIELDPDQPILLYNYSLALTDAERFDEALTVLQRCIRLDPDYAKVYGQMGVIHARRKNWAEAVQAFTEADHLAPGNPQITQYLRQTRAKLRASSQSQP